jgi:hypothetical protein
MEKAEEVPLAVQEQIATAMVFQGGKTTPAFAPSASNTETKDTTAAAPTHSRLVAPLQGTPVAKEKISLKEGLAKLKGQ